MKIKEETETPATVDEVKKEVKEVSCFVNPLAAIHNLL